MPDLPLKYSDSCSMKQEEDMPIVAYPLLVSVHRFFSDYLSSSDGVPFVVSCGSGISTVAVDV